MRKFGYNIIYFIELARFFGFKVAAGIMWKICSTSPRSVLNFDISKFKNVIQLRKGTSDLPIFYQVFCDLQYDLSWYLKFQPNNIIDAGANVGYGSLYFSYCYPKAKILAVEPESRNFQQLSLNVRSNPNIKPIHAGIWFEDGPLRIKNLQTEEASFEVEKVSNPAEAHFNGVTIDGLAAREGFETIDILKMDIEGAEYHLLNNNPEAWLDKTRCLIIELHDNLHPGTSQKFFQVMSKYNWFTVVMGENIICIKL